MIPVLGGTGRLVELLGGPEVLPTDPRFAASPVPLVVHIVAAVVYALLGAFQFSARLRRRHPGWHRRAGRLLVALGLAVALSGLWMTLLYPQKEGTGDLLYVFRLLASSGMGVSIILGLVAIRRRDIARHRAWMTRAYALALGAGTQAFTVGFGEALFGSGVVRTDLMMGAAWVINLAVAEWFIRRPAVRRARRARRSPGRRAMSPRPAAPALAHYELRVEGHLDEHWSTWFDGLTLVREDDGTTTLRGPVTDQAELHGLLAKVRDLGATLISVTDHGHPGLPRWAHDQPARRDQLARPDRPADDPARDPGRPRGDLGSTAGSTRSAAGSPARPRLSRSSARTSRTPPASPRPS